MTRVIPATKTQKYKERNVGWQTPGLWYLGDNSWGSGSSGKPLQRALSCTSLVAVWEACYVLQ